MLLNHRCQIREQRSEAGKVYCLGVSPDNLISKHFFTVVQLFIEAIAIQMKGFAGNRYRFSCVIDKVFDR